MAMTEEQKAILKEKQRKSGLEIGKKNLIPFDKMDKDIQKDIAKKGAFATNEIKARKKDIKSICNELLNLNAVDIAQGVLPDEISQKLIDSDINITLYDLIVAKQIETAIKDGNVRAAEFLRDSSGDKPTERIEQSIDIITETDRQLIEMLSDRIDVIENIQNGKIIDGDVHI